MTSGFDRALQLSNWREKAEKIEDDLDMLITNASCRAQRGKLEKCRLDVQSLAQDIFNERIKMNVSNKHEEWHDAE